jgi:uncharacterized protein (DUF2141 family)
MKKTLQKISFLLLLFSLLGISLKKEKTSTLLVKIENIQNPKGFVYVTIYDKADSFPENGKELKRKKVQPTASIAEVVFEIPNGTYAIASYQDVNENQKLDKTFVGYPKEPFGFSNNFKPRFSKPAFEDCSFRVSEVSKEIQISLID